MTTPGLLNLTTPPTGTTIPRPAQTQTQAQPAPSAVPAAATDQVSISMPGDGQAQPTQMERLLDSNTVAQLVGAKLKGGETITISSNGEPVLQIKKDGVSGLQQFKTFASDVFRVTSAEVSNIVAQDPAFAFKESALAVKDQVFRGVPPELQGMTEKAFLPMVRVVAIALDTKKAINTFKHGSEATHLDKFVDGAHLATDMAGLGGAISYAIPAVGSSVATALTVAGLVGDIAAYGYHVMKYFLDRGMVPPDSSTPPPQVVGKH